MDNKVMEERHFPNLISCFLENILTWNIVTQKLFVACLKLKFNWMFYILFGNPLLNGSSDLNAKSLKL